MAVLTQKRLIVSSILLLSSILAFGRAVTTKDYEAIIPQIYPNVQSIVAFGGEEADPPEYGKVIVVIKPKNADRLSISEKDAVAKKIRSYSVGAVEPKIMDPSVLFIDLSSYVYFNPNKTRRDQDEIKADYLPYNGDIKRFC